jgi:hypothetical protein
VLELLAVLLLSVRPLALSVVVRIERLRDLVGILYGMQEVDQLALCVLPEEAAIARRTVGHAHIVRGGKVLLGAHNPRLVLERAEDAPAVRSLVDMALDLHRP